MRVVALALALAALASVSAHAQSRPRAEKGCTDGRVTELKRPFQEISGSLYFARVPQLRDVANTNERGDQSPVVLCENGKRLGPAHSLSDDISRRGQGRFTHFTDGVYFSASDNSNANTNGRKYTVTVPPAPRSRR